MYVSSVAPGLRFPSVTQEAVAVLLAGPSGSGKSHLARQCGVPLLRLDDFYFDEAHPDLPRKHGRVDWDDPGSWDKAGALAALGQLCRTGSTTVPDYDISQSRRVGHRTVTIGESRVFVAEGIFAPTLLAGSRSSNLPVEPIYLDRPRSMVAVLRLIRDLRAHRKAPSVLLRRGLALWRSQPNLRREAVATGFLPLSMRASQARIEQLRDGSLGQRGPGRTRLAQ